MTEGSQPVWSWLSVIRIGSGDGRFLFWTGDGRLWSLHGLKPAPARRGRDIAVVVTGILLMVMFLNIPFSPGLPLGSLGAGSVLGLGCVYWMRSRERDLGKGAVPVSPDSLEVVRNARAARKNALILSGLLICALTVLALFVFLIAGGERDTYATIVVFLASIIVFPLVYLRPVSSAVCCQVILHRARLVRVARKRDSGNGSL